MSDKVEFEIPRKIAYGVACIVFGALAGGVAISFADNNFATSTVTSGDLVIPYDGYLMLDSGPVNGIVTLKFDFYHSSVGGASVWTETQDVDFYDGKFSVALGEVSNVTNTILDAEKVWLGITVVEQDAMGNDVLIELSGRQAIEPSPYAAWTANSANLNVAGNAGIAGGATVGQSLAVTGNVSAGAGVSATGNVLATDSVIAPRLNGALKPSYQTWSGGSTGDGGAGIVNDNGTYKALMVVGNNSEGGDRRVELYDDVSVNSDLRVNSNLTVGYDAYVDHFLTVGGGDILLGRDNPTRGDGGRALVHDFGDTLVVNFANDFAGGVEVRSNTTVTGDLNVNGRINGLSQSQSFTRTSVGDTPLGVYANQGICFLTMVRFDHNGRDTCPLRCEVYLNSTQNQYYLAVTEGGCNAATDADCRASCLMY